MTSAIDKILRKRREEVVVNSPEKIDFSTVGEGFSFGLPPKKQTERDEALTRIKELSAVGTQRDSVRRGDELFIRGVDRATGALASIPESLFGTIKITAEGPVYLSPSQIAAERELGFDRGGMGLPGAATRGPENVFERGVEVAGETLALSPLLSQALAAIPQSAKTTLLGKAQNFLRGAGESFMQARVSTTAAETGAGFAAGATGEFLAEKFPRTPGARFVGEMIGGTAAPMLIPGRAAVRGSAWLRDKIHPFTPTGGRARGEARIDRLFHEYSSEDSIRGLNQPSTIDPATGQYVLTPMARTGGHGPTSLEKDVARELQELGHLDERMARGSQVLQDAFRAEGGRGDARDAREFMIELFGTRLQIAAHRVERQLAKMGDDVSIENANEVFNTEWNGVLKVVRDQENELFGALPQDAIAPTKPATGKFQEIKKSMTDVGEKHIPTDARKFLSPTIKTATGVIKRNPRYLGDSASVAQLRRLYSNLREEARRARKEFPTRAKNADDLADSINDSLAQTYGLPEMREVVDVAVGFSRDVNQIIRRFELGRVGGRSVENRAVRSTEFADSTIGLGKQAGRGVFDDMLKVIRRAQLSGATVDQTATVDAASQYMRSRFIQDAKEGNVINQRRARDFLTKHRQILEVLPKVEKEIQTVIRLGREADATVLSSKEIPPLTALRDTQGRYVSPRVAKAAMILQKDPSKFFQETLTQRPLEVKRNLDAVIKTLDLDETGDALRGMRAGWVDFLLSGAKEGTRDVTGKPFMSGEAIADVLRTRQGTEIMRKLFPDAKQRNRIRTVVRDLRKLEIQRHARGSQEGVLGDVPNKFLATAFRFMGAGLIRRTHPGAAIQQTGAGANAFAELLRHRVQDPGRRFVVDAVANEGLWRDVAMARPNVDGTLPPKARRKLAAWAATIMFEHGAQIRPEDEETAALEPPTP